MQPAKDFYFINKDPASKSLSRSEASVASQALRHVQGQIRKNKSRRRENATAYRATKLDKGNSIFHDRAPSKVEWGFLTETIPNVEKESTPSDKISSQLGTDSSSLSDKNSVLQLTDSSEVSSVSSPDSLPLQQISLLDNQQDTSPSRILDRLDIWTQKTLVFEDRVSPQSEQIVVTTDLSALSTRKSDEAISLIVDSQCDTWSAIPRFPIQDIGSDPFSSAPNSFSNVVNTCLLYYESLWKSRSMSLAQSPGRQAVLQCISNRLQLACTIAAMTSQLENLYGIKFPSSSSTYTQLAIHELQKRLNQGLDLESNDVCAIMNLYVAEAYRKNYTAALTHLNGAATAYEKISSWRKFDPDRTLTICSVGEEFFLPLAQAQPLNLKTVADPGPAKYAPWYDSFWRRREVDRGDRLASTLILSFRRRALDTAQKSLRIGILQDMLEYTRIRRRILHFERSSRDLPNEVVRWAHLRRLNLILRLMNGDLTPNDLLSHCVRICLISWLNIAADVPGFSRSLEIIAAHLRDAVQQLSGPEIVNHSMLMIWMLFIGAVTGSKEDDAPWFIRCLAEFLVKSRTVSRMDRLEWVAFIEDVNQGFFYSPEIQRQSVEELALRLHSVSSTLTTTTTEM